MSLVNNMIRINCKILEKLKILGVIINTTCIVIISSNTLQLGCSSGNEIIKIDFKCDSNTNDGNAVVVKLYQLSNADKFRFSNIESLTKNPETTLGNDLIANSKFEKIMVPGEFYELNEFEIKNEASYLGVIADFHSPAVNGWQQIIPLNNIESIVISVHENTISVDIEEQ